MLAFALFSAGGCAAFVDPGDYPGRVETLRLPVRTGDVVALRNVRAPTSPAIRWRILVLPGSPSAARFWAMVASRAPADWDFVAIDRPGYANSNPTAPWGDMTAQAHAIAPLLDRPAGVKLLLVGECYAAPIALRLAELYPEKIDALATVSGYVLPLDHWQSLGYRIARTPPVSWLAPTFVDRAAGELARKTHNQQLAIVADAIDKIQAPTLILHGENDWIARPNNARWLAKQLSPRLVELRIIPDTWHPMNVDVPDAVLAGFNDLIDRADTIGGIAALP